jgi:hypothetical protein
VTAARNPLYSLLFRNVDSLSLSLLCGCSSHTSFAISDGYAPYSALDLLNLLALQLEHGASRSHRILNRGISAKHMQLGTCTILTSSSCMSRTTEICQHLLKRKHRGSAYSTLRWGPIKRNVHVISIVHVGTVPNARTPRHPCLGV